MWFSGGKHYFILNKYIYIYINVIQTHLLYCGIWTFGRTFKQDLATLELTCSSLLNCTRNAFDSPWASAFVFAWQWEGWVRVVRLVIRNVRLMYYYLIKFLRSLLCGVLKFVRKLTTSFLGLLNLRLRYIRQINMESDDECELDSTWEDEYKNKEPRKKVSLGTKLYFSPYCNYATFIHWILFRNFIPFYAIYCSSYFLFLYEKILQTTVSFGISVCV